MRGYNPYVLTSPTVGEFVYAAVSYLRHSQNAPLEDLSQAAIRRTLRVLLKGQFVGIVGDRDFTDNGVPARFFGVETTLPVGPVKLARVSGAPIIPVLAIREDDGGRQQRYAFHILDAVRVVRTDDEEADIQAGMEQVVGVLEHGIGMAPEQWVMFQRVWDDERPRRKLVLERIAAAAAVRKAAADATGRISPAASDQMTGNENRPVSPAGADGRQ
jgi:KDO2-lipid IV(A) lauroyltransferase